jgi:predicted enzyme related to lactoylglutathione lyase
MSRFYSRVFGWKTAQTTAVGEDNFPRERGQINGGPFERTAEDQAPSVVIAVDDIREAMKRVLAWGGKVLGGMKPGEPDDIPGVGLYAAIVNTEGNRVGVLQPRPMGGR